jgi:hypothetical protein
MVVFALLNVSINLSQHSKKKGLKSTLESDYLKKKMVWGPGSPQRIFFCKKENPTNLPHFEEFFKNSPNLPYF